MTRMNPSVAAQNRGEERSLPRKESARTPPHQSQNEMAAGTIEATEAGAYVARKSFGVAWFSERSETWLVQRCTCAAFIRAPMAHWYAIPRKFAVSLMETGVSGP